LIEALENKLCCGACSGSQPSSTRSSSTSTSSACVANACYAGSNEHPEMIHHGLRPRCIVGLLARSVPARLPITIYFQGLQSIARPPPRRLGSSSRRLQQSIIDLWQYHGHLISRPRHDPDFIATSPQPHHCIGSPRRIVASHRLALTCRSDLDHLHCSDCWHRLSAAPFRSGSPQRRPHALSRDASPLPPRFLSHCRHTILALAPATLPPLGLTRTRTPACTQSPPLLPSASYPAAPYSAGQCPPASS